MGTPFERFAPGESPFRSKGVIYRNFFDFVGEQVPGGKAALFEELRDARVRAFAEQTFLASTFYDALPSVPMCAAAAALAKAPANEFIRELARYSAERDTKGVYRVLLRLVSPSMVMDRTPAVARQYFNFVTAAIEKTSPRSYQTSASGIPDFLAQFYMTVTEAFLTHALRLAGARGLKHRWLPATPDGDKDGVALVRLHREISWD